MNSIEIGTDQAVGTIGRDIYAAASAARDRRDITYLTVLGVHIATIVPLPQRMPPRPAPPEPPWTDATALGQAQNGEANTAKWAEAWDYIESRLQGCDPDLANARIDDPYGPEPGDGDPGYNDYDDEQDEPEPDDYDPGPGIDDVGGASEIEYRHPDAYEHGEPWGPGNPAPGSAWDTRRSNEQEN